jgi:uncharacterized protein YjfI (DUF2170 family)
MPDKQGLKQFTEFVKIMLRKKQVTPLHNISRHCLHKEKPSMIIGSIRSLSGVAICHVTSVIYEGARNSSTL